MKARVSRVSLAIAIVLFFTGFFAFDAYSVWFAMTAAFAGSAAWFGAERTRIWAILFLVLSLVLTVVTAIELIHERQHRNDLFRHHPEWEKH